MENQPEIPQVEFNLSMAKINLTAEDMQYSKEHYLRGEFDRAFYRIKVIRLRFSNRFDADEIKECEKQETIFFKPVERVFLGYEYSINGSRQKVFKNSPVKQLRFEKYYMYVDKLLKKYGFDVREKSNRDHVI